MRWQDERAISELINDGVRIGDSYLTIARMGEDRKESQIGSQPIADARRAREWLDRTAAAAAVATGNARFRIRLWRPSRTAVRSVQTRLWLEPDALSLDAPASVPAARPAQRPPAAQAGDPSEEGPTPGPDPYCSPDEDSPRPASRVTTVARSPAEPPRMALASRDPLPAEPRTGSRLSALAAERSELPAARAPTRPLQGVGAARGRGPEPTAQRPPSMPSQQPNPGPRYAPQPLMPCPTCAASATTSATLNARLAELSGQVAALKVALRDKENAAGRSQHVADQRRARIAELEAQGDQAARLITSLRREVKDLNAGADVLLAELNALTAE